MQMTFLRSWAPHILSILRILTAATFLTHGTMKLFGWPAPFPYPLDGLTYTAAILEVVGGLLLIVGLFSRPVAFVLSGEMAVAYFMGHAPQGFFFGRTSLHVTRHRRSRRCRLSGLRQRLALANRFH
jgi:putative oxidoreductase